MRDVRSLSDFQPWMDRILNFPAEVFDKALRRIPPDWIGDDSGSWRNCLNRCCAAKREFPNCSRLATRPREIRSRIGFQRGTNQHAPDTESSDHAGRFRSEQNSIAIVSESGPDPGGRNLADQRTVRPGGGRSPFHHSTGVNVASAGTRRAARAWMSVQTCWSTVRSKPAYSVEPTGDYPAGAARGALPLHHVGIGVAKNRIEKHG